MQYAAVAGSPTRKRDALAARKAAPSAPARPEAGATKARRGRPPRITRDQILAAGLSLVRKRGAEALTARALAERIGASPMALYGHFESKQALLAEIAAHAVEKMGLRVPERGDWRTLLAAWLRSIRREVRAHPELLPLLAGEGACSRYLLASSAKVTRVLVGAGLTQRHAVQAVQGSMWAVIGFVVCENAEKMNVPKVLAALPEEDRELVRPIARDLVSQSTEATFEGVLTRMLAGLSLEVGARPRDRSRRIPRGGHREQAAASARRSGAGRGSAKP